MIATSHDPQTPVEWQEAVDVAHMLLTIDSARQYGLIKGGPAVNVDRCAEIIKRGAALGFVPAPIDQLAQRYL